MTEQEVRDAIKKSNQTWEEFEYFMRGQTMGLNEDGTTNFYDCDVEKFIRWKGKIPSALWD